MLCAVVRSSVHPFVCQSGPEELEEPTRNHDKSLELARSQIQVTWILEQKKRDDDHRNASGRFSGELRSYLEKIRREEKRRRSRSSEPDSSMSQISPRSRSEQNSLQTCPKACGERRFSVFIAEITWTRIRFRVHGFDAMTTLLNGDVSDVTPIAVGIQLQRVQFDTEWTFETNTEFQPRVFVAQDREIGTPSQLTNQKSSRNRGGFWCCDDGSEGWFAKLSIQRRSHLRPTVR